MMPCLLLLIGFPSLSLLCRVPPPAPLWIWLSCSMTTSCVNLACLPRLLVIGIVSFYQPFGNHLWDCCSAKWPCHLGITLRLMANQSVSIVQLNRSFGAMSPQTRPIGYQSCSRLLLHLILLCMQLTSSLLFGFSMGWSLPCLLIWLYQTLHLLQCRLLAILSSLDPLATML